MRFGITSSQSHAALQSGQWQLSLSKGKKLIISLLSRAGASIKGRQTRPKLNLKLAGKTCDINKVITSMVNILGSSSYDIFTIFAALWAWAWVSATTAPITCPTQVTWSYRRYKSRQTVYSKPIRLLKDNREVVFIILSIYFNVTWLFITHTHHLYIL